VNVLLKLAILALTLAWAYMAAATSEAAFSVAGGAESRNAARLLRSADAKLRTLDLASERIATSWARPLVWHAGAAETLAGLYASRYDLDPEPALLRESARWSSIAIELAPVQPRAWTRLALLDEAGFTNPLCAARECLTRSFETGRMFDGETACWRLQALARLEPISADDQRVRDFLLAARSRRQIARCLNFLPERDLFRIVLEFPA
jgi:hypothetical protein